MLRDSCLKFRHICFLWPLWALLLVSCGKALPVAGFRSSMLLSESSCAPVSEEETGVTKNIASLFYELRAKYPSGFFFLEPRDYNFDNPLILSIPTMQSEYMSIKNDRLPESRSSDMYYLFTNSQRYESQRCQFSALAEKKKYDLRPYLAIVHECTKKYNDPYCDDSEYVNLTPEKESWLKSNVLDLCLSFSKIIACNQEYKLNRRNNTLGAMIRRYQNRFESERYMPLFQLRPTHNKYQCNHEGESVTMQMKVYAPGFDPLFARDLLDEVERTWSYKRFSLKLELTSVTDNETSACCPPTKPFLLSRIVTIDWFT